MAQFSDLLGRVTKIEGDTAKVREILGQMLSSPVAAPTIVNNEEKDRTEKTKKMQKDIEKLSDDFQEYKSESEKWVKDVISNYKEQSRRIANAIKKSPSITEGGIQRAMENALRNVMSKDVGKGGKSGVGDLEKSLKKQENAFAPLKKMAEAGLKPGSIHVHDRDAAKFLKSIAEAISKGNTGTGGRGSGGLGSINLNGTEHGDEYINDFTPRVLDGDERLLSNREKKYRKWSGQIGGITAMALGGINLSQALGIEPQTISTQIKYTQNIRAIAFQTEGLTGETEGLQKAWQKFGKVAAQTGKSAAMFEEQLVDNLRRGVKSRKDAISITKTGLQLSTMIGSNAQETAGLFNEWNMTMGLSSNEMDDLSRGIQDVARFTGVTGDRLMQAVKASEQFAKRMKDAGTSSAVAAKNIIMIQTMAEKLGVADSMKDLMSGLSNNADLLFKASDQTKSMLFNAASRAGVMQDAINGTVLNTRKGMKSIAEGLGSTFKSITGFDIKDIDDMPADLKSRMNLVFESAFGMGINEFAKSAEVMREGGKGFAERMAGIDKQLQQNLTTEEKRALEIKKSQLALSAGLEQSTMLADAAKSTGTISEAVNKLRKDAGQSWPEMKSDLLDLTKQFGMSELTAGIQSGDQKSIAKAMGLSAAKALKEAGGKDYQADILSAIESNDMSKLRELQSQMTENQQKLGVETATKLDPITEAVQKLNVLNETIRNFIGGLLGSILGVLGANGLILLSIAGTLGSAALLGPDAGIIGTIFEKLGLKNMFGGVLERVGRIKDRAIDGVTGGFRRAVGMGPAATIAQDVAMDGPQKGTFMDRAQGESKNRKSRGGGGGGSGVGSFFPKEDTKIPKMPSFKDMRKMGVQMVKGAAALAVITIGLVALATVIIKISQGILGIAGLDADEAAKIALQIAGILLAAGKIAGAVLVGAAGLYVLGRSSKYLMSSAKDMVIGSFALLVMTPAILGLGLAIVGISKAMMSITGIDMGVAAKVASNVAGIIFAAGKISLGVLMSAAGLAGLGLLVTSGFIWPAIVSMALGSVALFALTPAIIGIASAVIHLASGVMKSMDIDPGYAAEVANNVGNILLSAGKIATGVLKGATALIAIGALSAAGGWLGPIVAAGLMLAGAAALLILTPAVVKMATSVIKISSDVMSSSGVDSSKAEETAKSIGVIFDAAGAISKTIIKEGAKLTLLSSLALAAPFIAGAMYVGVGVFKILSAPIVTFMRSINTLGSKISKVVSKKGGEEISNGMQRISEVMRGIGAAMKDMKETVLPLTEDTRWFGGSDLEELAKRKDDFADGIGIASDITNAVITKVHGFNASAAKSAVERLAMISKIMNQIGTSMSDMKNASSDMDSGSISSSIFKKIDFGSIDEFSIHVPVITITADKINVNGMKAEAIVSQTQKGGGVGANRNREEQKLISWAEKNKAAGVSFGSKESFTPKKGTILEELDPLILATMNADNKQQYEEAALAYARQHMPKSSGAIGTGKSFAGGGKAALGKVGIPSGAGGGSFQLDNDSLIMGHAGEWIHMVPEGLAGANGISNFRSVEDMMSSEGANPVMAKSAPMADVHDRVAKEQAGAEAGANSVSSDELVQIAASSSEQVELLRKLVELQEKMRDMFGDTAKKSGMTEEQKRAMTKSTTKALDTPQFYRWQYGQYGENASKDMVVMPT